MNARWLAVVALHLPAALTAQDRIDRRVALESDASIRIVNLMGSIRVIGWDKDTLAVSGTLGRGAGKFFYFGGGGRGAKLGVEVPEQYQVDEKSDLEVRVPARARLWIKAAAATIEIVDFKGGLDLYSVSGTIRVQGNPSQVYAESMDGAVEFSGVTPFARVKTASGNITLAGTVDDATATTVGGLVSVTGLTYQRVRLESVTGNIDLAGAIPRGASVTAESHSGTITISVPGDAQASFYVNNFQGAITNGLTKATPRLVRERGGHELSFTLGQGAADVNARNFKGDVVLKRRS